MRSGQEDHTGIQEGKKMFLFLLSGLFVYVMFSNDRWLLGRNLFIGQDSKYVHNQYVIRKTCDHEHCSQNFHWEKDCEWWVEFAFTHRPSRL